MERTVGQQKPIAGEPAPGLIPVRRHIAESLRLAAPVMVSRAGLLTIFTVDMIMAGRQGGAEVAYLGLGGALQAVLMLVSIGILQGTMILSSQAYGAMEFENCGRVWRTGLLHAGVLGILFGIVCLFGEPILLATGQTPDLSAGGGRVSFHFGWGMPGMLFYIASTYFLESIGRPRVSMTIMIALNLVNVGLNGMFIFGWGGLVDPMGAAGAVLATSIIRWLAFLSIAAYILSLPWRSGEDVYAIRAPLRDWLNTLRSLGGDYGRRMRRLGLPMGITQGLEAAAFSAMVLLAGHLGAASLAAHQITMNAVSVFFMLAVGMSAATSIRVGNAVGRRDQANMRRAGFIGAGLGAAMMSIPALILTAAPGALTHIFIDDPQVYPIAVATLTIAGCWIILDGAAGVFLGALRGTGDIWIPMVMLVGSLWVMAVPLAWVFGFRAGLGAPGLMWGMFVGMVSAALLLSWRFNRISRHLAARA